MQWQKQSLSIQIALFRMDQRRFGIGNQSRVEFNSKIIVRSCPALSAPQHTLSISGIFAAVLKLANSHSHPFPKTFWQTRNFFGLKTSVRQVNTTCFFHCRYGFTQYEAYSIQALDTAS
jgi:hypothetical protein